MTQFSTPLVGHAALGAFPALRLRRLRQAAWVRDLVREHRVGVDDLVWALIVHDGPQSEIPISAMPGVNRLNLEALVAAAASAYALGIKAIALFPHIDPALKDQAGSEATNPAGLVAKAVRALKQDLPQLGVIVDVALDPYTDHGHDGVLQDGCVLNDQSVERLVDQAVLLAEAGADVIAPSDMMDGRVGAIRTGLEAKGHQDTLILSYAAKYASGFYGPYREAIGSAAALVGDKRTYQMDPGNSDEALRECALDIAEGADMLMVKPGLAYLDILYRVKQAFGLPTFAFQVSGEYSMIKAAAMRGWLDETRVIMETLSAFKRAGADAVISYFARDAALVLQNGR